MQLWNLGLTKNISFFFVQGSFFFLGFKMVLMLCHYRNCFMKTKYLFYCSYYALLQFHWMLSSVFFKPSHFWAQKRTLSIANWNIFSSSQAVHILLNVSNSYVMSQIKTLYWIFHVQWCICHVAATICLRYIWLNSKSERKNGEK